MICLPACTAAAVIRSSRHWCMYRFAIRLSLTVLLHRLHVSQQLAYASSSRVHVLSDVYKLKLNDHRCDVHNKPVWRELACVAHT